MRISGGPVRALWSDQGSSGLLQRFWEVEVGAVFSIEASRLARNGRDWHQLIELCGMAGTLVVDTEGIYDPRLLNDRLLLGLKGTMSEFELGLLRQRSHEAARQKARRGELRFLAPIGYLWPREGKLEMDPDQRIQQVLHLAFAKLVELGSVRQVLLWFRSEGIELPTRVSGGEVVWRFAPVYESVLKLFKNPTYAGAYAFGRTQSKTSVVNGRSRKTDGHRRSAAEWHVLIRDHHPRLHFLGAVRAQPSHDFQQLLHEIPHGPTLWPRRPRTTHWDAALQTLRLGVARQL